MFKKKRSRWMQGLLWAEEQIQQRGLGSVTDEVMAYVYNIDDFGHGAISCIQHYQKLKFRS